MRGLLAQEALLRLAVFAGGLALLAVLEAAFPRRARAQHRTRRWPGNLGLVLLATLLLRLALPVTAVAAALAFQARGLGLIPALGLPAAVAVPLAVVLLDLGIYAQHRVFHAVPLLWRLHRVHHTDLDFDVTTALRFHPLEILLSMLIKLALVLALGAPPEAVLLFELLLNASAMFNHANLALPAWLDARLRPLLVTPDMHRIHHSTEAVETNSNFGFSLALWDRLFATYRATPAAGHAAMTVGQPRFRAADDTRLDHLLTQPLR
jgi:sterol desaturase/sphingolipid hydroxylase (fatty acid hydroxylase superfamily)